MLPFVPLGPRARVVAALAAAAACGLAAIAGVAACLTAPPADIGTSTNERPQIIHTSVQPPEGLLDGWPADNTFRIPILLPNPTANCQWQLNDRDLEGSTKFVEGNFCITSLIDGGVIVQEAHYTAPSDGHCHVITFVVAHGFSSAGVPDSAGGDYSIWEYEPPGALCNFYDAGAFQDGAFPPVDSGPDVLITPESGPLPESGVDP